MKRARHHLVIGFLAVLVSGPAAGETLRGAFEIVDGDTLRIGGRLVDLVGIKAPVPGSRCTVAGKAIDCGRISTTALLDLTAGARVVCDLEGGGRARCLAGGYDLSEGMAYTGWALADPPETSPYARHERAARDRGRGMWRRER